MEETIWRAAEGVMQELEEALRPVGLETHRLDEKETGNIPTVEVKQAGESDGIVCNILPVNVDGLNMTFIQLYMTLTAPAPEEQQQELEQFIRGANERFMLGSLLAFQGMLCMRYSLVLDPAEPLEPAHTQTAFAAFLQQAAVYARLGRAVCDGAMTAQAALAYRDQGGREDV